MTSFDPHTLVPADVFARMVALRRDLHQHPELSLQERRTMAQISAQLDALGISHRTGVAGTGILAEIPGRRPGPKVALRADTDALPIHEETGLPFASVNTGIMHACGHDGHTSMLLGGAALLAAGEPPPVTVRLMWQPAEEAGDGALKMIAAGCLDGVGLVFGGHLDRTFPAGTLVVTEGAVNASTDTFRIEVRGKGGHGARPHETVDAVVVACAIVGALQTLVSRELDPAQPAVVTVGSIHAGSAPNVIAPKAELSGTLRSLHPDVRRHLLEAVPRVCRAVADAHRAEAVFLHEPGTPALINGAEMTALARRAAAAVVGEQGLAVMRGLNMGGEDFAEYLQHIPGCYIRFGGEPVGRPSHPAHSGRFDFDERALAAGARWYYEVAHLAGAQLAR